MRDRNKTIDYSSSNFGEESPHTFARKIKEAQNVSKVRSLSKTNVVIYYYGIQYFFQRNYAKIRMAMNKNLSSSLS